MAGKDHSLSLVIKAVDEATAPLKALSAKIKQLTSPIREVGASIAGLGHAAGLPELKEGFHKVGEGIKGTIEHAKKLGETLLFSEVAGAAALYELTKSAVEAGSELKHAAERAGLTVDAYAQLRFAAGQAGVTQEEFAGSMDKFNKSLGLAKGHAGPLYEFLQKHAPTVAQQVAHAKNMTEALGLMAGVFTKVQDPMRRAALQQAAFGKGSREMAMFLGQGEAGIAALMSRYKQIAGSQEEFADRSEESEKALNETGAAFEGLRNAAATGLMPALKAIAEAVTGIVAGNRESLRAWAEGAGKAIAAWVKDGGIIRLKDGLVEFGKSVMRVVDFLGGFKNAALIVGGIMAGPLIGAVVNLGGALWNLGFAVLPVLGNGLVLLAGGLGKIGLALLNFNFGPLLAGAAAFGPFIAAAIGVGAAAYEIYRHWDELKFLFKDFWNTIVFDAQQGWAKLQPILDGLTAAGQTIAELATNPGGALSTAKDFYFGGGRPSLGAGQVGAPAGGPLAPQTAKVSVHFENVPKGVRVAQDKAGTADLDVNMGYANPLGIN